MANTKSAAKRARQTKTRTAANRRVTSAVKTAVKTVRKQIAAGQKDGLTESLRTASSKLDKAVKTGQVHRNKANRLKSRLAKRAAAVAA
jgi:small subunit ribosomal protein S20